MERLKGDLLAAAARSRALVEIKTLLTSRPRTRTDHGSGHSVEPITDPEEVERFLHSETGLQHWGRYVRDIPPKPHRSHFRRLEAALRPIASDRQSRELLDSMIIETLPLEARKRPHGYRTYPGGNVEPYTIIPDLLRRVRLEAEVLDNGKAARDWTALAHLIVMCGHQTIGPFWRGRKPTNYELALLAVACGFRAPSWVKPMKPADAIGVVVKLVEKERKRHGALVRPPAAPRGRRPKLPRSSSASAGVR